MTTRRTFVISAGAAACASIVSPAVRAQSRIELRASHVLQPTSEHHKILTTLAETVAAKSQGRVGFKIFPAAQLGSMTNTLEQASQGEPILAYVDASYLGAYKVPEFGILSGPFLTANQAESEKLANSPLVAAWSQKLKENAGLSVLALNWFDGHRQILATKPVPEPSDLKGMKIRVPPVPTWRKTFEALGAIPTTVEFAETYSALSQGVVQAVESSLEAFRAARFTEVVKHVTLTNHMNLSLGYVMSDKVLQTLRPDDRAMLAAEFKTAGRSYFARLQQSAAAVRKEFESNGVSFTNANATAYRSASRSFYNSFPEWPAGLYDQVQAAIKA